MYNSKVKQWKKKKGEKILREFGIQQGQKILDFGCGSGVYTILCSKIVANSGQVYALDSDEEGSLHELEQKIEKKKLTNIEIIKTSGEIELPFENKSLDVVLFYDVIHLLEAEQRRLLIEESARVLKENGFISYHATHLGGGYNVSVERINSMMESVNLMLRDKYERPMFHWINIENSQIFNYSFSKEDSHQY